MPGVERPVNAARSPQECLETVWHEVDKLLVDVGLCEKCCLLVVCHKYSLDYVKLLPLYIARDG